MLTFHLVECMWVNELLDQGGGRVGRKTALRRRLDSLPKASRCYGLPPSRGPWLCECTMLWNSPRSRRRRPRASLAGRFVWT